MKLMTGIRRLPTASGHVKQSLSLLIFVYMLTGLSVATGAVLIVDNVKPAAPVVIHKAEKKWLATVSGAELRRGTETPPEETRKKSAEFFQFLETLVGKLEK